MVKFGFALFVPLVQSLTQASLLFILRAIKYFSPIYLVDYMHTPILMAHIEIPKLCLYREAMSVEAGGSQRGTKSQNFG